MGTFTDLEQLCPVMAARLRAKLAELSQLDGGSSLLGQPVEPIGFEYLKMNRWGYANNESCVMSAIASAALPYMGGCLANRACAADDSQLECWQTCLATAVVRLMPRKRILAVLQAEASAQPPACALPFELFRTRVDFFMGPETTFNFGYGDYGHLFTSMRGWLVSAFPEVPTLAGPFRGETEGCML